MYPLRIWILLAFIYEGCLKARSDFSTFLPLCPRSLVRFHIPIQGPLQCFYNYRHRLLLSHPANPCDLPWKKIMATMSGEMMTLYCLTFEKVPLVQHGLLVEEIPGPSHTCPAVSVLASVTEYLTQNAFRSCSFCPHYLSTHIETSSV